MQRLQSELETPSYHLGQGLPPKEQAEYVAQCRATNAKRLHMLEWQIEDLQNMLLEIDRRLECI